MSDEQRSKAAEFLTRKATRGCPMCGAKDFSVLDLVNESSMNAPATGAAPLVFPAVLVACNNCYLMLHFAALPMGIPGGQS
jgi:hypothetical protein